MIRSYSELFSGESPTRIEPIGFYMPARMVLARGEHIVGSTPLWRVYVRTDAENTYTPLLPDQDDDCSTPEIAIAQEAGKIFINRYRKSKIEGGFDWVDVAAYDIPTRSITTAFRNPNQDV